MNNGCTGVNRDRYELDKPFGYSQLEDETKLWYGRLLAAGGGVTGISLNVADGLVKWLKGSTYASKMMLLYPYLGVGIGAARAPLIDRLNAALLTNPYPGGTAFVDANFSEATGLQGTSGSGKIMSTNKTANLLNASALQFGMGMWDRNLVVGSNSLNGSASGAETSRYGLDLRTSTANSIFRCGSGGPGAATVASSGHYYGQRSTSTASALYKDGNATPIATAAVSDNPMAGAADFNMAVMGAGRPALTDWAGRVAVHYFTDGTLTTTEITDWHAALLALLITPTGR